MLRKVILIDGSNVKNEDELPGVKVDIKNWLYFLCSSCGGAFGANEIVVLQNPTPDRVISEMQRNATIYMMVVFSGHGFHSTEEDEDFICLNPNSSGESFLSVSDMQTEMQKNAKKGLLIMDACRGLLTGVSGKWIISEQMQPAFEGASTKTLAMMTRNVRMPVMDSVHRFVREKRSNIEAEHPYWRNLYLKESKMELYQKIVRRRIYMRLWWKSFRVLNSGFVTMKACAITESAHEYEFEQDGRLGGHFTTALLDAASLWKMKQNSSFRVYSTIKAFEDARRLIPNSQQNPEYYPDETVENIFALS